MRHTLLPCRGTTAPPPRLTPTPTPAPTLECIVRYKKICEDVIRIGRASSLGPGQAMLTRWFQPLAAAIDEHQRWLWEKGDPHRQRKGRGAIGMPK